MFSVLGLVKIEILNKDGMSHSCEIIILIIIIIMIIIIIIITLKPVKNVTCILLIVPLITD